jgi:hypothetical protein
MRKLTREEFQQKLDIKRPGCGITVGKDYTDTHTACTMHCEKNGEFQALPGNVIRGGDHPSMRYKKISEKNTTPKEEVQKQLVEQGRDYITVGDDYVCLAKKCTFIDRDFGEWEANAFQVLSGSNHRKRSIITARPKRAYTKEEIQAMLDSKIPQRGYRIEVVEIETARKKGTFKDPVHGEWSVNCSSAVIFRGTQHPARSDGKSKKEEALRASLQNICGRQLPQYQKCRFKLDIFDKETMTAVEFNGLYWHSEGQGHRDHKYHLNKTLEARKEGIRVIHIWEHLWDKRPQQVLNYLSSVFMKAERVIPARKCELLRVPLEDAKQFLEAYHIQGFAPAVLHFGLYYKGELVSLIGMGAHHRNTSSLVLNRFVTKTGVCVIGALGRLSKHASNHFKTDFISWVDRCLSDGGSYVKAGFVQEDVLAPDYFYFDGKTGKVISKQARQKSKIGTPENMTEREHAEKDGLKRVWDCGKIRFRYKYAHL